MHGISQEIIGSFRDLATPLPPAPAERGRGGGSAAGPARYQSHPVWGARQFEAGETTRLNAGHWARAYDDSPYLDINDWLRERLSIIRARSIYESRNNGMLAGVVQTLVDDVVGPDGPMFEVQSSDDRYNVAAERVIREWFRAPTTRPNVSGAAMLKLWLRNLARCGEFCAVMVTDPYAEGPVRMRLHLRHPRRLCSPADRAGDPRVQMGVEFDQYDRPTRYWFAERDGYTWRHVPYAPDDVIHEFLLDEEGQARGFPWFTPSLQPIADLRDYDDQVQDAARQMADQAGLLYTEHPDAVVWTAPESTTVERRTIKMVPPGWKPATYEAGAPPVQYPDYRAERLREVGRPMNMPLLMVRLDASKHNYSSARMDTQSWNLTVSGTQDWLSGTPESVGTLNRLFDVVLAEARFSEPALRRRPDDLIYVATWPTRPHVDPTKGADAETISLETGTDNLIDVLAGRGTTLERHIRQVQRVRDAYVAAGLPLPKWMQGGEPAASTPDARKERRTEEAREAREADHV